MGIQLAREDIQPTPSVTMFIEQEVGQQQSELSQFAFMENLKEGQLHQALEDGQECTERRKSFSLPWVGGQAKCIQVTPEMCSNERVVRAWRA